MEMRPIQFKFLEAQTAAERLRESRP